VTAPGNLSTANPEYTPASAPNTTVPPRVAVVTWANNGVDSGTVPCPTVREAALAEASVSHLDAGISVPRSRRLTRCETAPRAVRRYASTASG
jgi:hypothetical protein